MNVSLTPELERVVNEKVEMPCRLSVLAEHDLEDIWLYVAEDASPTTADRRIDAIVDRFELFAASPRANCRAFHDTRWSNPREVEAGPELAVQPHEQVSC